jgi:hypothetical protein
MNGLEPSTFCMAISLRHAQGVWLSAIPHSITVRLRLVRWITLDNW